MKFCTLLKMLRSDWLRCKYLSNDQDFLVCLFVYLFVRWGLTSLLNIWGNIATVQLCFDQCAAIQECHALDTVYRHRANQSLCFPWMWNARLEYTITHFNILGQTGSGNPSTTFHTPANAQLYDAGTVIDSLKLSRKCTVRTGSWTRDLCCANPLRYPLAYSCFSQDILEVIL